MGGRIGTQQCNTAEVVPHKHCSRLTKNSFDEPGWSGWRWVPTWPRPRCPASPSGPGAGFSGSAATWSRTSSASARRTSAARGGSAGWTPTAEIASEMTGAPEGPMSTGDGLRSRKTKKPQVFCPNLNPLSLFCPRQQSLASILIAFTAKWQYWAYS